MKEWTYSKVPIFIVASLMLVALFLGIVGCGEEEVEDENEEDSEIKDTSPKVIEIIPEPGAQMEPKEIKPEPKPRLLIRFNQLIIPTSGTVTLGRLTLNPSENPYEYEQEPTDILTWILCYHKFTGLEGKAQLILRGFHAPNGETQTETVVGWYEIPPVDIYALNNVEQCPVVHRAPQLDLAPPELIGYSPMGHQVDPETVKSIRLLFDRQVIGNVAIVPPIDGTIHISDGMLCTGIVSWNFAHGEQLRYGTEYHVTAMVQDAGGNAGDAEFRFTTRSRPGADIDP